MMALPAMGATDMYPCFKNVAEVLDRSEPASGWTFDTTENLLRAGSSVSGVNYELRRSEKVAELRRVSPTGDRSYKFEIPHCYTEFRMERGTPATAQAKGQEAATIADGWTDQDLSQLLKTSAKNGRRGFIYVWSPNMPLALRGFPEAQKIAKSLNLDFIAVRDPHSSAKFAQMIVTKRGFPKSAMRPLDSSEVIATGAINHFPAIVLFEEGRLHSRARPGYDEAPRLRALLEQSYMTGPVERIRLPSGKGKNQ